MALLRDSDGKSEATVLLEMLLDRMEEQFDSISEALRIPLGMQEMTMDGFRKWWAKASPAQRMEYTSQHGVTATLDQLSPVRRT